MHALLSGGPHVVTLSRLDRDAIAARMRQILGVSDEDGHQERSFGVLQRLEQALQRADELPAPKAVFVSLPVVRSPDGALVAPVLLRDVGNALLLERLAGSRRVTLYVVTLGSAWDACLAALCDADEAAAAWFLDQVGTLWVDEASRSLESRVEADMAREGLSRTRRVRAGYRGHPSLEAQKGFCDLAGAGRIGVEVLPSGVMTPSKTISGILGWEAVGSKNSVAAER